MPTTKEITLPFLPEKAIEKTYENGYKLVFVPKRGNVFNINTWVRTGSIHEDEKNNGVSHFLEHLMFKGTTRFAPGIFDKEMEGMGGIINAATWKDFTFYYITGPQDEKNDNFLKALDMHADMLLCSTLPNEEIGETYDAENPAPETNKRERGVVIEEIGMRGDQPWTKVYNNLNHMMYPDNHPYRRDVIGTADIISSIPRESIQQYYHRWYSADSMSTIVVGDFDFDTLEKEVLKAFDFEAARGNQTVGESPVDMIDLSQHNPTGRYASTEAEVQTTFLMLGFHGPNASDLKNTIALDVICHIFGEGNSSRLYQHFIEKPEKPLFNTITAGQMTFKLGNVIFIDGNINESPTDKDAKNQLNAVLALLDDFLNEQPITELELARAKKNLKVNFAETSEEASGIAEELGESLVKIGTLNAYTEYLPILEALTLSEIHQVAKTYLDTTKYFASVLLPKTE